MAYLDEEKEYYTSVLSPGSSYYNNGSLSGGVTWNTSSGTLRSCVGFNGTNQSIFFPYINIGTSVTYSMWFNANGLDGTVRNLFSYMGTLIRIRSTDILWYADVNTSFVSGALGSPAPNVWNHLAITQTGSFYSMYLNNALIGSGIYSNGSLIGTGNTSNRFFSYTGTSNLSGLGDDLRIYSRALSAGEIGSIYRNFSVTQDLEGYWKFDEGIGSIAYDNSIGLFSYYSDSSINGTIDEISFLPSTPVKVGSLLIQVSGTNEQLAFFNSGITNTNFSIQYPRVYAVDNNLNSGSPWTERNLIVNSPINIVGSNMYETKVKIHYR